MPLQIMAFSWVCWRKVEDSRTMMIEILALSFAFVVMWQYLICCDIVTSPCKRLNFITVLYFSWPPGHLDVSKVGGETSWRIQVEPTRFLLFFCCWWFFPDLMMVVTMVIWQIWRFFYFLRRDIFVQEKSMWLPAVTGSKDASWTVLDDYENDVL